MNNTQEQWEKTPTGNFIAIFPTYKARISQIHSYTSRKGNNYNGYYIVNVQSLELDSDGCAIWSKHLGKRVKFEDAKTLAEGGE